MGVSWVGIQMTSSSQGLETRSQYILAPTVLSLTLPRILLLLATSTNSAGSNSSCQAIAEGAR